MSKFPVPENFFYCPPLNEEDRAKFIAQGESSLIDLVRSSKLQDGMIKWTMDSDENGIQIFFGEDPQGSSDITLLAGVTEVYANFDEIAALFRQETKEAYADYTKKFAKDLIDSSHLYTISTATPERPRHYIGIRWIVLGSPYPLVANRDWCYLECQDDFEMNGRRGWGRSMTSINLPCCPDFQGHLGTIRATFVRSGFIVFESQRPGYLQVIHMLQTDFKGNVPKWVVKIGMKKRARTIGDFDKYLREKRLSAQPFLREHELVPKAARSKCFLCQAKFGAFSTKVRCRKCGEVVCGKCNRYWEVKTTKGRKMIRVCSACSISGGNLHDRRDGTASAATSRQTASDGTDDRSESSQHESTQHDETISLSGSQGPDPHYYPSHQVDRRQPHRSGGYHGNNGHNQGRPMPSPWHVQRGNKYPSQRGSLQRDDLDGDYTCHEPRPSSPQPPFPSNIAPLRLPKDGDKSNGSGNQPLSNNNNEPSMQRVDSQASYGSVPPPPTTTNARDTYIMEASDDDAQFDSFVDARGPPPHVLQQRSHGTDARQHGERSAAHYPRNSRGGDDDDDDHHYFTRESEDDNDAMSAYSEYSHAGPPHVVYPPRNPPPPLAPHRSPKPRDIQEIDPYAAKPLHGPMPQIRRGGPPPGRPSGPWPPAHMTNPPRYGQSGYPMHPHAAWQAPPLRRGGYDEPVGTPRDNGTTSQQREGFLDGVSAAADDLPPRRGRYPAHEPVPNEYGAPPPPRGADSRRNNFPYARDVYDPPRARGFRDYPVDLRDAVMADPRPYENVPMHQRRDFPFGRDGPVDDAADGEYPRAGPFDPRYAQRDPRQYPREYARDPREYPRDLREYGRVFREYPTDPSGYSRDPRDYAPSRDVYPDHDRRYNPRRYQDSPRQVEQVVPPTVHDPPPSVHNSADSAKDDSSSLKSESIQDEVLRAMKALNGDETPDPQQLLVLYKQLQQLNLDGSAAATAPSSAS
ncbi:hypothetical protein H310_12555 [Aphanomyces invadans]|uniref:FYVE-type domain-containing protein n=1 Tax=Aphanomyces invadans TaxID=157072 RepID=A0A024TIU2_9STRA|nr:hypothetical protein H310_12555 [Aphanomyces invadans]ETV93516.1 hypothetical protein H310_12555 [Aphanomyces invadans]|eukprot:XP_008877858.1 hypothetical protein H310_12555 [Aphanomyces invadans]